MPNWTEPRFVPQCPKSTPWGPPQQVKTVYSDGQGPGIVWVSTAGHGGVWVRKDLNAKIPAQLRQCAFNGDGNWYEEDCSWCAPYLAFPDLIEDAKTPGKSGKTMLEYAQETYSMWYAANLGPLEVQEAFI